MSRNTVKDFFLAIAFFLLSPFLVAQPNFQLYTFNIKKGEGENYYEREAKRNLELETKTSAPERFLPGVGLLNAAQGLKIAKRKGSISDLQEILRINYDWITESNLMEIEDLKAQSEVFEGDNTVYQKAEIVNYYTLINNYNKILKTTPPTKFEAQRKKEDDLKLAIKSVTEGLTVAKEAFESAKESAAEMHFGKGRELARGEDMQGNKEAAKRFRYALQYVPDFRDAQARYDEARRLGTTRLGISTFESFTAPEYGDLGGQISNDILGRFLRNGDEFEFFEVIDRDALDQILAEQKLSLSGLLDESTTAELGGLAGVNSIIVGNVTQASADRQRLDPVARTYEKKIKVGEEKYTDENGKEKTRDIKETVSVIMRENNKLSNATVSASFKILDVATGAVLAADNLTFTSEWEGVWYTYLRGNKKAIPNRLNRTEVPFISEAELVKRALNNVSNSINRRIVEYAQEVSQ